MFALTQLLTQWCLPWQFVSHVFMMFMGVKPVCARGAGSHSWACVEGRAQAPPCRLGSSSLRRPTSRGPCARAPPRAAPGSWLGLGRPPAPSSSVNCFLPGLQEGQLLVRW